MAVKRPRPRDLASIGLLASLGCYLLLASPRDAFPDGTSQRRALVASAPPSSDIIQDEYIVTIKPFAYAYDRAVGSCSASPSGTFYGVFQNLDECEDITINIISDHYPDEISWVLHDDTTDTMISTATDLTESFCLKSGAYTFTIHDSYGDGLCCEYGVGSYTVTGSILGTIASGGEYGHEESTSFTVDTGPPPNLCIRIDYDGASSGQIRSTNSEIGVCGISSGYAWDEAPLSLGSFQTQSQVNQYTFTDGTQCGATLRTTTVVVEKGDTGQSSYTIATTQPEVCVYRIVLTLPYCTPDYSEYETTYFGDSQAANLLSTHGGSLIQTFRHTVHGFAATLTSAAKSSLLEDPSVERIEESFKVTSRGFREEEETKRNLRIPYFNLSVDRGNWGMGRICKRGWAAGKYVYIHDAQDIDVYILDTGINESHSDFTGRIGNGKVCIGSAAPATHGTHIASLAAGTKYGPAKRAIMHPVQVLDAQGEGSSSSVLCGMEWVLEQQLAYNALNVGTLKSVANVAFGTNGKTDTLDEAIASMVNSGITTIIAAGNYGDDACNYSPFSALAITVGGLDDHDYSSDTPTNAKSETSNFGSCIDVFAPGRNLEGASSDGVDTSESMSGTSTASGLTAGAAALFVSETSEAEYSGAQRPQKVKEALLRKAEKDFVVNPGSGSPNLILQTTSSMCREDSHCDAGKTCMIDGSCVAVSR